MNNRMIPDIDRNTTTTTLKSPNPSKPIIPLTNQPTLPPYPQNPPNKPHPLISRKGPVGPCYNRNHISPSPPSPPPPSPPSPPPPSPPPSPPPDQFIPIRSRNNDMIPLINENGILIP